MQWKPITEITDSERYGKVLRVFHPDFVHEDFNPEGVLEAVFIDNGPNEKGEWIGAVWNNDQDCWNTEEIIEPTHYIILTKP